MAAGLHSLRPVACVAALNATAQGLVGAVLGVLALCVCFCALGEAPQASGNDLAQYFTYYLQGVRIGAHFTLPGLDPTIRALLQYQKSTNFLNPQDLLMKVIKFKLGTELKNENGVLDILNDEKELYITT